MATLQISVPDEMKMLVEARVRDGLYADASDYVRNLIRSDLGREGDWELTPELLAAIEEGEASGYIEFDRETFLKDAREGFLNESKSKYHSD